MRLIRPLLYGLVATGLLSGLTGLSGCSSQETADVSAPKTSKRDEAGKKFPFAEKVDVKKGAGGTGKAR